jgi:hypothetical protein
MTKPFNNLTPAQMERLDMLAEECAEVIMAIAKIKRHGLHNWHPENPKRTNIMDLNRELQDVGAVMWALFQDGVMPMYAEMPPRERWENKLKWTHHQGDVE